MANEKINIQVTAEDKASPKLKSLFGTIAGGVTVGNLLADTFRKVTSTFVSFAKESLDTSLTLDQMQKTLPVLAKNMGKTEQEINDLIYAIRGENKSMKEAVEITRSMTIAGLDQEQALTLLNRARDIGATFQMSSADANRILLDAMLQMQPTMLKDIGLTVRLADAKALMAEKLGITEEALTSAQIQQGIFNLAMQDAEKFTGAYDASMTSANKVMMSAKDAFADVKLVIGDLLDNAMFPISKAVLDMIRDFRAWAFTSENEMNPTLKGLAELIGGVVLLTFNTFLFTIQTLWNWFVKIKEFLIDVGFIEVFNESWQQVSETFKKELLPQLIELWKNLQPLIELVLKLAGVALVLLIETLNVVLPIITENIDAFMYWVSAIMEVVNAVLNAWKPAFDEMGSILDWVGGKIDWLITKLSNLIAKIGQTMSSISGLTGSALGVAVSGLKSIFLPARAEGGAVQKGRAYMVGERGAEMFVPNQNGSIIPNNQLAGVGNITINMNNSISGDTDITMLADRVGREIMRVLKSNVRI